MKNKKLFYYGIIMESLIFVIFNLFQKKKRYKISSPYYLGYWDLSIFRKFDDFNFINGSFPRFFFFIYVVVIQFNDE